MADTEVPTTFALAPMGVALPPRSVPRDSAQASTPTSMPSTAAMERMTGIIVAAKGILSTKALVTAESQRMMTTIVASWPPLMWVINEINSGVLEILFPRYQSDPRPVYALYTEKDKLPLKVQVCINYLTEYFVDVAELFQGMRGRRKE